MLLSALIISNIIQSPWRAVCFQCFLFLFWISLLDFHVFFLPISVVSKLSASCLTNVRVHLNLILYSGVFLSTWRNMYLERFFSFPIQKLCDSWEWHFLWWLHHSLLIFMRILCNWFWMPFFAFMFWGSSRWGISMMGNQTLSIPCCTCKSGANKTCVGNA